MATIRQLKSGKWQAQVRRHGVRPAVKSFKTKTEADRWARLLESEIDRGVFVDRSEAERVTVGELIDRYLVEVTPHKKSARNDAQRLKFLKQQFGAYSAAALRPSHIAAFRDMRIKAGRAGATVIKEINSLSHLLDVAVKDWGIPIPSNPAKLIRRPVAARGRERRLQPVEESRLIAACEASNAPMLASAVHLALATAMRMGEILSLDWRNVDLEQGIALLPDTKTGDARQIPLSTVAIATLKALPRHFRDSRVYWRWVRADSLENAWRRAVQKAGVADLRFHDLRHEAVSRLFERGLNPMEVAAISGHKTLQMLKRYTHLRAADLVKKLA
jgi:integrase